MVYLANENFSYAIKHVVHFFEKDKEVRVPAEEIPYMLEQKFIREDKGDKTADKRAQLESAIASLKEKISKEMNEDKLAKLDKKKAEYEAELAKLDA